MCQPRKNVTFEIIWWLWLMFSTGSIGKLNLDLPPMVRDISALGIFDKSRQSAGVCVYITSHKLLGAAVVSEKAMVINTSQERLRIRRHFSFANPHNKGARIWLPRSTRYAVLSVCTCWLKSTTLRSTYGRRTTGALSQRIPLATPYQNLSCSPCVLGSLPVDVTPERDSYTFTHDETPSGLIEQGS